MEQDTRPHDKLTASGREADESQLRRSKYVATASTKTGGFGTGGRKNPYTGAKITVERQTDKRFCTGTTPSSIVPGSVRCGPSVKTNAALLHRCGLVDADVGRREVAAYQASSELELPHFLSVDRNFEHRAMANAEVGAALFDYLDTDAILFVTQIMAVENDDLETISVTGDDMIAEVCRRLEKIFPHDTVVVSGFAELGIWDVGAENDSYKSSHRYALAKLFSSVETKLGRRSKPWRKRLEKQTRRHLRDLDKAFENKKVGACRPVLNFSNYHLHYLLTVIDRHGEIRPADTVKDHLRSMSYRTHDLRIEKLYDPRTHMSPQDMAWHRYLNVRRIIEYAIKRHEPSDANRLRQLLFRGCSADQGVFNIVLNAAGASSDLHNRVEEFLDIRGQLLKMAKLPLPAMGRPEAAVDVSRRLNAKARPLHACGKSGAVSPVSTIENDRRSTWLSTVFRWVKTGSSAVLSCLGWPRIIEREEEP